MEAILVLLDGQAWSLEVLEDTSHVVVRRGAEQLGVIRYDPDHGFGPVPPPVQPVLAQLQRALRPYNERLRFLQRASESTGHEFRR